MLNLKKNNIHKEYCFIGLSKFNYQIAHILKKEGQKVTIIDNNQNLINSLTDEFDSLLVCDAMNINELDNLGIKYFDYVVIGFENIEKSITICSNLKELKVKKIMSKAKNAIHQRILKAMGVELAIIPEVEIAKKLAYQTMYDLKIDVSTFDSSVKNTFIVKLEVNNKNLWGKKMVDMHDLKNLSASVISIKRSAGIFIAPVTGQHELQKNDEVCLIVNKNSIAKLKDYFMAQ